MPMPHIDLSKKAAVVEEEQKPRKAKKEKADIRDNVKQVIREEMGSQGKLKTQIRIVSWVVDGKEGRSGIEAGCASGNDGILARLSGCGCYWNSQPRFGLPLLRAASLRRERHNT